MYKIVDSFKQCISVSNTNLTHCEAHYNANLQYTSIISAISRQTIDIPHPTYDTADRAILSSCGISCITNEIVIRKYIVYTLRLPLLATKY